MIVIDQCEFYWNAEKKTVQITIWNLWKALGEDIFHNDNFTSIFHFFERYIYRLISVFYTVFTQLDNDITIAPAYGIYISQLMRYARTCSFYLDLLQLHRFLSTKLLIQGFLQNRLIVSFKQLFGRYQRLMKSILSLAYRWQLDNN